MIEFGRVTTRGGDRGESSLYDGTRLRKDDLIFQTLGDLDELTSTLGVAKASVGSSRKEAARHITRDLNAVQQDLIRLGAVIATPRSSDAYARINAITKDDVAALEKREQRYLTNIELDGRFVVPGETLPGAFLHVARTVCRRLERRIVSCIRDRSMPQLAPCQNYLNRLADLLFVVACFVDENG